MTDYLEHARRHLPGGTDSLPLGDIDWLFVRRFTNGVTIAGDGSGHVVDLNPASSGVSWHTNAPNVFDITDPGSGSWGPTLKVAGLYLVLASDLMTFASAPPAGSVAELGLSGSSLDIAGGSWPLVGNASGANQNAVSKGAVYNRPDAYGGLPYVFNVSLKQNSGLATQDVNLDVLVVKLDRSGSADF